VLSAAGSHLEALATAAREGTLRPAFSGLADAGQHQHLADDHATTKTDEAGWPRSRRMRAHATWHQDGAGHVHPDQEDGPDA
jgi:hypothetical protein